MTSQYRHRRTSNPATAFPNPLEPGEIAVNTANRQIGVGDANGATLGAPLPLLAVRYFDVRAVYAVLDLVVNAGRLYRALAANGPGAFDPTKWELAAAQLVVSDTPPVGASDGTLWWESDSGNLYVRYNDGNSVQWVIASPQPDTSVFVQRTGDTMSGDFTLKGDPTTPLMAAPKQYADAQLTAAKAYTDAAASAGAGANALKVNKAGDTMTGPLVLPGNAVNALEAVPKQQLDATITGAVVRYDIAQALTDPQTVQARQNIYAAPFDALAYNGMQVNGNFDLAQEYGFVPWANSGYVADVWWFSKAGTVVVSAQAANGAVGGAVPSNWLIITVPTAQPALGASDSVNVYTTIEGYRADRVRWGTANAAPITIGFWSCHHRTGIYTGAIRNNGANRSYNFSYTHNVADTPQYNVVTIPGDAAGTWLKANNVGITVGFAMAAGATLTAPALNAWAGANYVAGPGQVNGVAATTDVFRISGVVVLPGLEAPSAARAPFIMRPFDQELILAQRYWEKSYNYANVIGASGFAPGYVQIYAGGAALGNFAQNVLFKVRKRIQPTVQTYSSSSGAQGKAFDANAGADVAPGVGQISEAGYFANPTATSPTTTINISWQWTADARM